MTSLVSLATRTVLVVSMVGTGCTDASQKLVAHTDTAVLKLLPGLLERPDRVWWSEQTLGEPGGLGPTDRILLVLLRFQKPRLDRALSHLATQPTGRPTKVAVRTLAHFPSEARSGLQLDSEDSEFYSLSGPIYQGRGVGRSPYLDGFVARIGEDRLLIRLFTR
ncbi:MAG: hypothetical protein AAFP04_16345 [Myxococcota bacterium]